MSNQMRILFALAVLALGAGWIGLRRGNAALGLRVTPTIVTDTTGRVSP